MKKIMIILLIIEIIISIVIIGLKESIIIGNYNKNSNIYKVINSNMNLPESVEIKCIVKNRFVYRDATYTVYYKDNNKFKKTFVRFEKEDDRINKIDSKSVSIIVYCVGILVITILLYYILKIRNNKNV